MAASLFVYGTLHPDHAPEEISGVVRRMKRVAEGTVAGTLYDLGDFPGLVSRGSQRVPGVLFELPNDPEALKQLDEYEEYHPSKPDESLFVRKKLTVTLKSGEKKRPWVYVYNQALPAAAA